MCLTGHLLLLVHETKNQKRKKEEWSKLLKKEGNMLKYAIKC